MLLHTLQILSFTFLCSGLALADGDYRSVDLSNEAIFRSVAKLEENSSTYDVEHIEELAAAVEEI